MPRYNWEQGTVFYQIYSYLEELRPKETNRLYLKRQKLDLTCRLTVENANSGFEFTMERLQDLNRQLMYENELRDEIDDIKWEIKEKQYDRELELEEAIKEQKMRNKDMSKQEMREEKQTKIEDQENRKKRKRSDKDDLFERRTKKIKLEE